MSDHVAELEKIYAKIGTRAYDEMGKELSANSVPAYSTNALLHGILEALVVIGKVIDSKS